MKLSLRKLIFVLFRPALLLSRDEQDDLVVVLRCDNTSGEGVDGIFG